MEADGTAAAAEAGAAAAAAGARPLTPEEEALRRNTDCVYFLASPLTCKKGNECDFRHSEGARMNPRYCWYWSTGNCLNPKCSFRHPPIDGMFGAPTPGIPAISSHYAAYNSGKQMVPCYYFQKGSCMKGDRCHFYHGPQSVGNNPAEQVAKVSSFPLEQPQTRKNDIKESAHPNNSIQQGGPIMDDRSKLTVDWLATNSAKAAAAVTPTEPVSNAVKSWAKSEKVQNSMPAVKKSFTTSSGMDHPECYQNHPPVESDPMQDWNQNYQMPPTDDLPQNSREADEFLGESSPGFDVLVDNDADASAYLHDEEDFGRDMYPVEDYEYAPADFDIQAHHESERINGMGEQGQIGQMYDGYQRKRHRTSSEQNMDRPFHSERRFRHREIDPVEMDGSDLRHRLRRRRINGPSSAISPERNGQLPRRDERYRERAHGGHHTHRDCHQGPRGSTLSSRLQGRIKLPGRSPDRVDPRFEEERDRRRLRDRLSPVRVKVIKDKSIAVIHLRSNLGKELLKFLKLPLNINNGSVGLAPIKMSLKLTSFKDLLRQTSDNDLRKQVTLALINSALDNGAEDNVNESDKLTHEEIEIFLNEVCEPLINGPKLEEGDENDEDFIDEQILLSRFIHFLMLPQCLASEELDSYYLLLSLTRKILTAGGPKRIRYTFPSIVFEALRLSLKYSQMEEENRDPKWDKKCQKIFQFVHQSITSIMNENNCADLCLRLFLEAAHNAAKTNVDNKETVAYEFISQAFSIYEEEINDSKTQLSCLTLIISTIKDIKFEIEDNYQPLNQQCCLNGAKLVKKSDQCRAILAAGMLFINDNSISGEGIKCIKKCVKIASNVLDLEIQLQLYVEILSHLSLLTNIKGSEVKELVRALVDKIEEQKKETNLTELIQRQYQNNITFLKNKGFISDD